jgi:mono/diheme cytochrome c family protein
MKKLVGLFIAVAIISLVAYQALMFYDNNFRYGRMRETPGVKPHEAPMLILETGIVPIHGGDATYRLTPAADLISPLNVNASATVARGKDLYRVYCAQCHGINYDGNGAVGQSFQPLPANLRNPDVQSKSEGELFKSISFGIPGGRQPALDTTILPEDRWYIIAFVQSLGSSYLQ